MRRGTAHVKIPDGRAILGPTRRGPQKEELFERQLSLKNIAFRETELSLNIERRQHLPVQDQLLDVGRMLGNGIDDRIAELLASLVPVPFFQIIGSILHEAGHDVFARGRNRRVCQTWDDDVYIRTPRETSVLGIIVSALHILDTRRD